MNIKGENEKHIHWFAYFLHFLLNAWIWVLWTEFIAQMANERLKRNESFKLLAFERMVYDIKCEFIPLQTINLMFASVSFAIRSALPERILYCIFNVYIYESDDIIIRHHWWSM